MNLKTWGPSHYRSLHGSESKAFLPEGSGLLLSEIGSHCITQVGLSQSCFGLPIVGIV